MEFIPKGKFIYTSNNNLDLSHDPNEDRVSFSQQSGLVFAIHIGFGILLSSNSSMVLDNHMKFQVVNLYYLMTKVAID